MGRIQKGDGEARLLRQPLSRADLQMHAGRKILALIPARGGSKGLPGKNVRPLAGKPLISWSIEAARKSRYVDRVIVSTDAPDIAAVAKDSGAEAPFLRPAELASDEAPTSSAVLHALDWLEREAGESYDFLALLQATSPLRTSAHLDGGFDRFFADASAGSLVSVCEADKSPHWMKTIGPDGYLRDFLPGSAEFTRRQDLPKAYALNGAFYIISVSGFRKERAFVTPRTGYYLMDRMDSIDIDTAFDFRIAELAMAERIENTGTAA